MQSKLRVEVSKTKKKIQFLDVFLSKARHQAKSSSQKNWIEWVQPNPSLFLKSDRDRWRIRQYFITYFVAFYHGAFFEIVISPLIFMSSLMCLNFLRTFFAFCFRVTLYEVAKIKEL